MELNSPRKDPYSNLARAEKALRKKGYTKVITVLDENSAEDDEGQEYQAGDLQIDQIVRLTRKKVFMGNENELKEPRAVYGLQGENGTKCIIIELLNDENSQVVEEFLRKIDRSDELKESYTS